MARKKKVKKNEYKLPPWWDGDFVDCSDLCRQKMSFEEEAVRNIIKLLLPFVILVGILLGIAEMESIRRESLPKPPKADWASGLDPSIPATQLIHYDIDTRTAVYGPPVKIPPPITPEEYEANKWRYQSKTIIRDEDEVFELDISEEEVIEQLMDELDFLDYYDKYRP